MACRLQDDGRLAHVLEAVGIHAVMLAEQHSTNCQAACIQGVNCTMLRKPVRPSALFDALAQVLGVAVHRRAGITEPAGAESTAAVRSLRILLAEDNPVNQEVARRLLESQGHRVDVVGNGREAVHSAADFVYDMILMDVQMPEMDGLTATAAIRALGGPAAAVPIIAMTANVVAGFAAECRSIGMNDYLPKPIRRQDLFRMVSNWAGGGVGAASPAVSSAPDEPDAALDLEQIQDIVATLGLEVYRRMLVRLEADAGERLGRMEALAAAVRDRGGEIPRSRKGLMALPGIGRKCADIVLRFSFGAEAIAVDTHVHRVCNRLGLARGKTEEQTAQQLDDRAPDWAKRDGHIWLITFAKRVCTSRAPKCASCPLADLCEAYQAGHMAAG